MKFTLVIKSLLILLRFTSLSQERVDKHVLSNGMPLAELAAALKEKIKGYGPSILVGHDFGAILSTLIAKAKPDLFSGMVLINGPSPEILLNAIKNDPDQSSKSDYAYHIVKNPEKILSDNNYAFLKTYLNREENSASETY